MYVSVFTPLPSLPLSLSPFLSLSVVNSSALFPYDLQDAEYYNTAEAFESTVIVKLIMNTFFSVFIFSLLSHSYSYPISLSRCFLSLSWYYVDFIHTHK